MLIIAPIRVLQRNRASKCNQKGTDLNSVNFWERDRPVTIGLLEYGCWQSPRPAVRKLNGIVSAWRLADLKSREGWCFSLRLKVGKDSYFISDPLRKEEFLGFVLFGPLTE